MLRFLSKTMMNIRTKIFACFLVLFVGNKIFAQEQDQSSNESGEISQEGVSGLIVDNTRTFMGRQFYDVFATAWSDQGVADGKNLSVHEQPTAVSGTRIWVEYNQQALFQTFLSPTRARIDAAAKQAAALVAQRFRALELLRLANDPDMGSDEF